MEHVSLCFDVDSGSLMCEAANIKEITQVVSVDNSKKICTYLCFVNITENSQHEYCLSKINIFFTDP
jgi:hypothetical protein